MLLQIQKAISAQEILVAISGFFVVLLLYTPFFFLSVWIETKINYAFLKKYNISYSSMKKVTYKAHYYSYTLLIGASFFIVHNMVFEEGPLRKMAEKVFVFFSSL